jgi:DNA-directed RNA polymerase specialized sigma24 family protein
MILAETVEQLMDGLKDRDRQIVSLCLQGYSTPEISERVGRTERTVQRKLEHVRKHLTELHAEVEAEA